MNRKKTVNSLFVILFVFIFTTFYSTAQSQSKGAPQSTVTPPTGIHTFPGDSKVYIQWAPVDDPSLKHYLILHGDESYVDTTSNTFYTETGLSNGTSYTYVIISVDTNWSQSSWSDEVPAIPRSRQDSFGYTFKSNRDLDENVTFQWTDISLTGTRILMSGTNENTGHYPIGFDFPFYNFQFDSFRVCTNGYISFTSHEVINSNNYQMPASFIDGPTKNLADEQGNIIAPFLTELEFPNDSSVFYQNFGSYLVIQYNQVNQVNPVIPVKVGGDDTFQIILYPDGSFDFVYLNMVPPVENLQVGWQNYAMDDGLVVTYTYPSAGSLRDGIKFDSLLIHAEHDFSATPATVQNIFFTEINGGGNQDIMYKIPIHGNLGELLQYSLNNPLDLALDMSNRKVYWMYNDVDQYLMRSDLDGHNAELVATLNSVDFDEPNSMDIDPYAGKIYWSDWGGYIRRMNLDGTSPEVVLPPDSITEAANVIAIDPDHQMIYWADGGVDAVFRCTYDGNGITNIYDGNNIHDIKLDPGNNKIYLAEEPDGAGFTSMELDGSNSGDFIYLDNNCNYLTLDPFNNTIYFARNDYQGKTYTVDDGIISLDLTTLNETTVIKNLSNDLRYLSMDIPAAPIHLSTEVEIASNIVKWPASADPLVTEYKIYRDNTPFPTTLLATVPVAAQDTMSYEDFDISIGNPYFYRVTAVDVNGISSPYSVQDSVTSIGPPLIANPQNQYAFPGDNKAYLKWSSVVDSNLVGYWIYRINYNTEQEILLDSLQNGDTTFVDTGAQNGNHYGYFATARNIYGVESDPGGGFESATNVAPRSRFDEFGYTWSSNRDLDDPDPPVYHWTDIATVPVKLGGATPIPMTGNDENTGLYPIGFEFPFYNFKFDSFRVSTNGIISFTSADPEASLYAEFPSGPLGGGMPPLLNKNGNLEVGNILAPYWIDMDFGGEIKAYYQNMGDHIIIQFDHVLPTLGGDKLKTNKTMATDNTFQVILYDDGSFEFVYQNVSWPNQGDLLIGWQDYSTYRGVTVTAAQQYGDYPPDNIDYENLIIRGQYDFSAVDQNVPNLLMTEIGQTALMMMMSKEEKTSEEPTFGSNIYKIPVNGISGEIVYPWLGLPLTISPDFINDYFYFYDDAFGGILRLNSDGTDLQPLISGYGFISSIRYNPFENLLYFCNGNSIYTANIDGTAVDTLISNSYADVLAFDNENKKIYWINTNNYSLYRANLDGSSTDSLTAISSSDMYDLEVNPGDNSLYWISQMGFVKTGSPNNIFKSDLDGNNIETIFSCDDPIYSIALDPFNNKLYYSTFVMDMIVPRKTDDPAKVDLGETLGINMLDLTSMSTVNIVPNLDMVLDMDLLVPEAPIDVSASAELAYNKIKWPASPELNVAQYNIYRDTNPYPTTLLQTVYPSKNKVGLDTLSFDDWNIEHDQMYYYRVVALDADGYSSAYSVQDSAIGIGPPDIDLNKETFVYGAIPKNTVLYDTLKVYNRGDTNLEIFTVDYVHGNEFWFSSFADLPETVIPGDSMLFYLKFTSGIGDFTDSLIIESDDHIPETDSLKIVSLSGSGFNQSPVVSQVYPDLILNEDFSTSIGDTLNDFFSDPDGDLLGYAISMKNGTLVLASENDKVITFTSISNLFGEDSLFISADDGYGANAKQGIKITINPINDDPVLTGIPDVEFPEEGSAQLSLNNYLSDVDSDSSQIDFAAEVINKEALPKIAADLTIAIDSLTHIVTFSGGDDSVGVYTVKITAKDDSNAVAMDTLKVTVTQVNDPPVVYSAISDITIIEDQQNVFVADLPDHFSDVEDKNLDYSLPYSNTILAASITGDSLFVSGLTDKNGIEMVIITGTDDNGAAVSDTVNISITPVNDPPVLSSIPDVQFPEEGSTQLHLNDYLTDVDNDSSEISFQAQVIDKEALTKIGEELAIAIDSLTHIITFSGGNDSVGVYTVMISATDDSSATATDTMKVTVTAVNDAPVLVSQIGDPEFPEDTQGVFAAYLPDYFSDVDDPVLTYSIGQENEMLIVEIRNDSLFMGAKADQNGTELVVVVASDKYDEMATDTLLVTVVPVNDAPLLAQLPDVTFPEEGSAEVKLNQYVSDIDNDTTTLNFSAVVVDKTPLQKAGEELTINIDSTLNVITFSGGVDSVGVYHVLVTVEDDSGATDMDTMFVEVTDVNDAPVRIQEISDLIIPEDTTSVFASWLPGNFSDVDDKTLTYAVIQQGNSVNYFFSGDSLFVVTKENSNGTDTLFVTAEDSYHAAAHDTFLVMVLPVNDPPVFGGLPDVAFEEEGSYTLKLNAYVSDVDNDTSTIDFSARVIAKNAAGKVGEDLGIEINNDNNSITFTGQKDSTGIYTVEITARDDQNASDMDTMLVTISDVNDPPFVVTAIADGQFPEDDPAIKYVTDLATIFADVEGKPLTFTTASDSGIQVWTDSTNALWIKSLADYFGTANVFVTAYDPLLASVTDTFIVEITNVNDAPIPFILYSPKDRDTMSLETFASATFTWEAADDIDSDELKYELRIANETFDTSFVNISGTTLTLQLDEFLEYNSIYAWSVFVSDGEFTVSAADTFGFITPYPDAIGDYLSGVPMAYKLHNNYPNPFNPSTTIRFDLPKSERVSLSVYNIAGQLVRKLMDEQVPAGFHNVVWDGKDRFGNTVGTGIYIYLLQAGDFKEVKKMTLVK